MLQRYRLPPPACAALCLLSACASIDQPTVDLAAEQQARLVELQKSHETALERYFDGEAARIERFLAEEWEPQFLKNFIAESGVLADLQRSHALGARERARLVETLALYLDDPQEASAAADRVITAIGPSRDRERQLIHAALDDFVETERLSDAAASVHAQLGSDEQARLMLDFAQDAHNEMLAQRVFMLGPVEQARNAALDALRDYYADTINGQLLLTTRLESAARLRATREAAFDRVAGEGGAQRVRQITQGFSSKVNAFIEQVRTRLMHADAAVGDIVRDIFE